jgi:predicted transcriptional regulator
MLKLFSKNNSQDKKIMEEVNSLKSLIDVLLGQIKDQQQRIKALEEIVFSLKENVKEEKQQAKLQQKKKWLTSYPDETK